MSGIKVEMDRIPELLSRLDDELGKVTRKAAFDVQAKAMGNIQSQGAVDTGATLNSVYVVTGQGDNGYGAAAGQVNARRPGHAVSGGDELDGVTTRKASAAIAVGTDYSIHIELGTAHMPARPFLIPAFDDEQDELDAIAAAIFLADF